MDLLESLLNLGVTGHLLLHLRLEEGAPKLLRQEILVHLQLIRVFVVVRSLVSDLLLSGIALDASLQGSLLVV